MTNFPQAVTLFSFFRGLGQTVGVAIGGVIFQNQMRKEILKRAIIAEHATEWSKDASALVAVIKNIPDEAARLALKEAYVDANKMIWIVICALAGVAFLVSLLTEDLSLDRMLETEQGYKNKQKTADEEQKNVDEGSKELNP